MRGGDLHTGYCQCPTNRYDPVGTLVFVDELADQRCLRVALPREKTCGRFQDFYGLLEFPDFAAQLSEFGVCPSLEDPAASPASISAWRTHLQQRLGWFMPNRAEIVLIAAHSES